MTIQEHKLIKVKIKSLKFDKDNPNRLTQEQMEALRKSMNEYGFLAPIVIDQKNVIADGEHRVRVYDEFGEKEIPAYRYTFKNDIHRRIYRQIANKLKGQHQHDLDAKEIQAIIDDDKLLDLAAFTGKDSRELESLAKLFSESNSEPISTGLMEDYEKEATARDSFESSSGNGSNTIIDKPLDTKNQCPKCGYAW